MFKCRLKCSLLFFGSIFFIHTAYSTEITQEQASQFVRLSLTCVDQEHPNVHDKPLSPKTYHPTFYGCYDWHSAVHGHWAMVKVLKTFPKIPEAKAITSTLNRHLTRKLIEKELLYFQKKERANFERPYGYAWFFKLITELKTWDHPLAHQWLSALEPMETYFLMRFNEYFDLYEIPVRHGTHSNTAFSLNHIYDYAKTSNNTLLQEKITQASKRYFLKDKNCPTLYEPSSTDFISPCLVEADLMRRVLPQNDFMTWFNDFFPKENLKSFLPLKPKNIKDPYIAHLIGLGFHRAWSLRSLANSFPDSDSRHQQFLELSDQHAQTSTELMFNSGYGGTHWLASFAIFYFTHFVTLSP